MDNIQAFTAVQITKSRIVSLLNSYLMENDSGDRLRIDDDRLTEAACAKYAVMYGNALLLEEDDAREGALSEAARVVLTDLGIESRWSHDPVTIKLDLEFTVTPRGDEPYDIEAVLMHIGQQSEEVLREHLQDALDSVGSGVFADIDGVHTEII